MMTKYTADRLIEAVERLTIGGGVTAPDDMVNIDDVTNIIRSEAFNGIGKASYHANLTEGLTALYCKKNADYGDSFGLSYKKYGPVMPLIRLEDKLNRASQLVANGGKALVGDESLRDTLLDMANYAVMTVLEMDLQKLEAGN